MLIEKQDQIDKIFDLAKQIGINETQISFFYMPQYPNEKTRQPFFNKEKKSGDMSLKLLKSSFLKAITERENLIAIVKRTIKEKKDD